MSAQFTKDEMIFVQRMLPHFMAGKTVEEAAAAVIEDDRRITSQVLAHSYSERESSERAGIRRDISDHVYRSIRAKAAGAQS